MSEISQENIDDTVQSLLNHIKATSSATENHHRSAGTKDISRIELETSLSGLLQEWEKFTHFLVQIVCSNCDDAEHRQPTPQPSAFPWEKASDLVHGIGKVSQEAIKQLATENDALDPGATADNGAVARENPPEGSRIDIATFANFHKQKDTNLREIRGLKDEIRRHPNPHNHGVGVLEAGEVATAGDLEDWKRMGEMWRQSASDKASQSHTTLRSVQDIQFTNSSTPESQLRAQLYRQQLRFIFRFAEIYYSFKQHSASPCLTRPANQLFERKCGDRGLPLQSKPVWPDRQQGSGESIAPLWWSKREPGSVAVSRRVNASVTSWILWLLLSSYTLQTWISCRQERTIWLEANGLTRDYMLNLARSANLDLLAVI